MFLMKLKEGEIMNVSKKCLKKNKLYSECCDSWDQYNQACMLFRTSCIGCIVCGSLFQIMQHSKHKDMYLCKSCMECFILK